MLKNYLLVALRIMRRRPFFSAINILGLGLAMAASLTIFQYVAYHYSFDQDVPDVENIYRVGSRLVKTTQNGSEEELNGKIFNSDLVERVVEDFPQVVASTQFQLGQYFTPTTGEFDPGILLLEHLWLSLPGDRKNQIKEAQYAYADSSFFEVFDYPFIYQSNANPLNQLNAAVISQKLATQLFGSQNPLDQIILLNEETSVTVRGVYNPTPNSSMDFNIIISGDTKRFISENVFIKLESNVDISSFDALLKEKMDYWTQAYRDPMLQLVEPTLHPFINVHFSEFGGDDIPNLTYKKEIFSFLIVIGFLILGIAWVNTINLTLSQLINRSKEIAMRKVVGANNRKLYLQSTLEFLFINFFALAVGLTISQATQPYFASNGLDFDPSYLYADPFFWLLSLLTLVSISALSILFQSKFLSQTSFYKKTQTTSGRSSARTTLQNTLLVFQFICTSGLLIGISIVSGQMRFMMDRDLGYNPENVVIVNAPIHESDNVSSKTQSFINVCSNIPGIKISGSRSYPGEGQQVFGHTYRIGSSESTQVFCNGLVTPDFIDVYEIDLIAGRNIKSTDLDEFNEDLQIPMMISEGEARLLGYESAEMAVNSKFMYSPYANDSAKHLHAG